MSRSGLGTDENGIARMGKTQHTARDLLDEVVMGQLAAEQLHVALQLRPDDLEAPDLPLELPGALHQARSCPEAVPAADSVKGEVDRKTRAEKHNKRLPRSLTPIIGGMTQHGFYALGMHNWVTGRTIRHHA